jgi:hypothetical protein
VRCLTVHDQQNFGIYYYIVRTRVESEISAQKAVNVDKNILDGGNSPGGVSFRFRVPVKTWPLRGFWSVLCPDPLTIQSPIDFLVLLASNTRLMHN